MGGVVCSIAQSSARIFRSQSARLFSDTSDVSAERDAIAEAACRPDRPAARSLRTAARTASSFGSRFGMVQRATCRRPRRVGSFESSSINDSSGAVGALPSTHRSHLPLRQGPTPLGRGSARRQAHVGLQLSSSEISSGSRSSPWIQSVTLASSIGPPTSAMIFLGPLGMTSSSLMQVLVLVCRTICRRPGAPRPTLPHPSLVRRVARRLQRLVRRATPRCTYLPSRSAAPGAARPPQCCQ